MLLIALKIMLGWSGVSLLLAMGLGRIMGKGSFKRRAIYYIPSHATAFRLVS
jgi:hypothetical protein